jgi:hypothetical protein
MRLALRLYFSSHHPVRTGSSDRGFAAPHQAFSGYTVSRFQKISQKKKAAR